MSATQTSSATGAVEKPVEKPTFTEKEIGLLTVAMLSLKSGAPDLDMQKFMAGGNFNTLKTAQNTWGVIKKKLIALAPAPADGEAGSPTVSGTTSHALTSLPTY